MVTQEFNQLVSRLDQRGRYPNVRIEPEDTNDIQKASKELSRLYALNQEIVDALFVALPFVEDASDDEVYKSHRVHAILKQIQTAIAKATGEQT